MDRPMSQLENVRPSGLKPPSRLPAMTAAISSVGRTLADANPSDLNSRYARDVGVMGPPVGVIKHRIPGLPEPPLKRKTLAERAAEPYNPSKSKLPPPPKSMVAPNDASSAYAGSKGTSSANGYRTNSATSTTSSASSVRPPSRQHPSRYLQRQHSAAEAVQEPEDENSETGISGKRKGTSTVSPNPLNSNDITLRKTRARGVTCQQQGQQRSDTGSQHSGSYSIRTCSNGSGYSSQSNAEDPSHILALASTAAQQEPQGQHHHTSLSKAFAELSLIPKASYSRSPSYSAAQSLTNPSPLDCIAEERSPSKIPKYSCTPSLRHATSAQCLQTPSPIKSKGPRSGLREKFGVRTSISSLKHRDELPVFLTKEMLTPIPAWDTKGRLEDMEQLYAQLRSQFASAADSKTALEDSLSLYKNRAQELAELNRELTSENRNTRADLDRARNDLHTTTTDLRQARRDHEQNLRDLERRNEKELGDLRSKQDRELQHLEREGERAVERLEAEVKAAKETMEKQKRDEIADLTSQHWEELDEAKRRHEEQLLEAKREVEELRRSDEGRAAESATEVQSLKDNIVSLQSQLDAANSNIAVLRAQLGAAESKNAALEQEKAALISKTHFLEGNQEAQSFEFTSMSERLAEAMAVKEATIERLRQEETLRRKLNATILELKGNIRVFVRTRPVLSIDGEAEPARVDFPDEDALDGGKELVVHAPTTQTVAGKERKEKQSYIFDRVFSPGAANEAVFEECRELVQSVVDGYNVSILSYGQTGSGKTFGMSGANGIIPSSISLLLGEIQRLKEKGWEYVVEASFVEVYNETLNDLLGDAKTWDVSDDSSATVRNKKKDKHEIHHDVVTGKTTVTNLKAVTLWPPPEDDDGWPPAAPTNDSAVSTELDTPTSYTENAVMHLLDTAAKNRRVAATNSNARSSRSHSVFMLALKGSCAATSESSEGVLNLVDLAGSERLKQSGAEGSRAKETAAINKSLSSLGDVIASLGSKGSDSAHVPYRNSKLTYLLQSSLGGSAGGKNSRTLMMLHLSPLQGHWQESKTSLLFGSKVHGTHIGSAKKK